MSGKENGSHIRLTRGDREWSKRQERSARFAEKIDWLEKQQLGLAIVGIYEKVDSEGEEVIEQKTLAYMLPLKLDCSQGLLLCKNGEVLVTQPALHNDGNDDKIKHFYQSNLIPPGQTLQLEIDNPQADMFEDIAEVLSTLSAVLEEVPNKSALSDPDYFAKAYDRGVSIGRILKIRTEKRRDRNVERVLERMELHFIDEENEGPPKAASS